MIPQTLSLPPAIYSCLANRCVHTHTHTSNNTQKRKAHKQRLSFWSNVKDQRFCRQLSRLRSSECRGHHRQCQSPCRSRSLTQCRPERANAPAMQNNSKRHAQSDSTQTHWTTDHAATHRASRRKRNFLFRPKCLLHLSQTMVSAAWPAESNTKVGAATTESRDDKSHLQ